MKRWPYAQAEAELVMLFTDRGYVGAQNYDAEHTGPEWNESGRRLVALLDSARRTNEALETAHPNGRNERAVLEEARETFARCSTPARMWLERAYTMRRRGGDRLMAAFNAQTPEGIRRVNLLPFTTSARETYVREVERDVELLYRKLEKDTRHVAVPTDPAERRAVMGPITRAVNRMAEMVDSLERGPTDLELWAHFDRVAAAQRFDDAGARRSVDKRIAAVEREADVLIAGADESELTQLWRSAEVRIYGLRDRKVPPLVEYELYRRIRVRARGRRHAAAVAAIRGGES